MAVIVTHPAQDVGGQSQQNITTIERLMQVEAGNIAEIVNSPLIPQPRSGHPYDARFRLVDRNFEIVGNLDQKMQVAVRLTYNNNTNYQWPNNESSNENAGKSPWEIGAQNINISYTTENAPLKYGYNLNGELTQLKNTAGTQLAIEGQQIIRQISFTYFAKAKKTGKPPINDNAVINIQEEQVAGFFFQRYTAMLMPMNAQYLSDVDDAGNIVNNYWQIDAIILENKRTWRRQALNVGVLAKFSSNLPAEPIYQYRKWIYPDASANIGIPPTYGSINDVMNAKINFANLDTSDWDRRFEMVPFSEVTEPVPLDLTGGVYENALKDPAKYPYMTIEYFEVPPVSWRNFNIPKGRS